MGPSAALVRSGVFGGPGMRALRGWWDEVPSASAAVRSAMKVAAPRSLTVGDAVLGTLSGVCAHCPWCPMCVPMLVLCVVSCMVRGGVVALSRLRG